MKEVTLFPLGKVEHCAENASSHGQLCAAAGMIFMQLHRYRRLRQPGHMRVYLSDTVWEEYETQVKQDAAAGEIFRADEISVLECRETGSRRVDGREHVLFSVHAKMTAWMERESDGRFLKGDRGNRHGIYLMEFVSAPELRGRPGANCPRCGAPMDASTDPLCRFCGESNAILGWVLTGAEKA